MKIRARLDLCLLALAVLAVSGCGKAHVKPNGKVVRGGQPFQLSEKGMFLVTFIPEGSSDKKTYATETKADGTFVIIGPERKGLPVGKYKVAVQAMDPYDKQVDKLAGKFTQDKTTLIVDVPSSGEVVVDVGK